MKKAGIIGYGRFGKVLSDLLKKQYEVNIYDPENKSGESSKSMEEVLECVLVFVAVPINVFEEVIQEISKYMYILIIKKKNLNCQKKTAFIFQRK